MQRKHIPGKLGNFEQHEIRQRYFVVARIGEPARGHLDIAIVVTGTRKLYHDFAIGLAQSVAPNVPAGCNVGPLNNSTATDEAIGAITFLI